MTKVQDMAAAVVEQIIARIEAGAGTWEMPWRMTAECGVPFNATTGVAYRGGNVMVLWVTQLAHGWDSPRWATYKQWRAADHQVRKGEKGTHLIHWSVKETVDDAGELVSRRLVPNMFVVFHVEQTDYVGEHPELEELAAERPVYEPDVFDRLLGAVPATITAGRPAYNFVLDRVTIPPPEAFTSREDYQATLAHELVHWTGHSSRLAREYGKRFGDQAYAVEELTAELGAAFLCAAHGVRPSARNDHAAYLASWVSVLRAEPMVLWSVASAAQKAADLVVSFVDARDAVTV